MRARVARDSAWSVCELGRAGEVLVGWVADVLLSCPAAG